MSPTISYDLEFRAIEDEAWYSGGVELSGDGKTLTVLADGFDYWKPEFRAEDFKSAVEVDEFAARFRPASKQLQDNECRKVTVGMAVCASLSTWQDDLRFYDAVVKQVKHEDHKMTNGEEECLCSFLLSWKYGPRVGCNDLVGIATICLIEPTAECSKLDSFINLAKEGILAANPKEVQMYLCDRGSQDDDLDSNLCERQEGKDLSGEMPQMPERFLLESGENIGASDRAGKSGPCYFVLVDNLHQNMSTSAMSQFLLQYTLVETSVYPYPTRSSIPFGSAAIATDSRQDIERIYAFLVNPNHLVVTSDGRPWVIHEKVFDGAIGLLSQSQNGHICQESQELQLVHSGTEAYKTASRARTVFLQFRHHMEQLYAHLVSKQEVILGSFHSGNTMR